MAHSPIPSQFLRRAGRRLLAVPVSGARRPEREGQAARRHVRLDWVFQAECRFNGGAGHGRLCEAGINVDIDRQGVGSTAQLVRKQGDQVRSIRRSWSAKQCLQGHEHTDPSPVIFYRQSDRGDRVSRSDIKTPPPPPRRIWREKAGATPGVGQFQQWPPREGLRLSSTPASPGRQHRSGGHPPTLIAGQSARLRLRPGQVPTVETAATRRTRVFGTPNARRSRQQRHVVKKRP